MDQSYGQKMQAARERLRDALAPDTGPEKSITTWIGGLDLVTIDIIAGMVERAVNRARAEGYDAGYAEAGGKP